MACLWYPVLCDAYCVVMCCDVCVVVSYSLLQPPATSDTTHSSLSLIPLIPLTHHAFFSLPHTSSYPLIPPHTDMGMGEHLAHPARSLGRDYLFLRIQVTYIIWFIWFIWCIWMGLGQSLGQLAGSTTTYKTISSQFHLQF